MLSMEDYSLRIAGFQGEELDILTADVNEFLKDKEQAGCRIADIRPTEAMTTRPQTSELDTEIYYRTYAVFVVYLEPRSQAG